MKNKMISVMSTFSFFAAFVNLSVGGYYYFTDDFKSAALYFLGSTVIGIVSMFE